MMAGVTAAPRWTCSSVSGVRGSRRWRDIGLRIGVFGGV
jgi:hypothetical protein